MPFTLGPISRRTFIKTTVGLGASLALSRLSIAEEAVGGVTHVALISDTHIAADTATINREQNMAANLRKVVQQVLAAEPKPTVAFIDGDLAFLKGEPGDYTTFLELIKPLREAGMTVHMTLGNHDHRDHFIKAMYGEALIKAVVPDRCVGIVPVGHTNWFLLDSLDKTNNTPGLLGETQIKWLGESLKQHADKPAIIMVHHDPARNGKPGALTDSAALYEAVKPHAHVKAIIFGHTHVWQQAKAGSISLINLPAVAYYFGNDLPLGWTSAAISDKSINLTLHAINNQHDGEKVEIPL